LLLTLINTLCTTMFNIQNYFVLPTQCIYVLCMKLITQHKQNGFYNRKEVCLPRHKNFISKHNSSVWSISDMKVFGKINSLDYIPSGDEKVSKECESVWILTTHYYRITFGLLSKKLEIDRQRMCKSNIEELSSNHCCRGKYILLFLSVSGALGIQHVVRVRVYVAFLHNIFPHYNIKGGM
jgi:hypothetical protein